MAESKTLRAARAYTARGLGVFPCNGKIPATPHGFQDASTHDAQLVEWFDGDIARNIGVAIPANVVVLDIDPRNDGDATLGTWCKEHGDDWLDDAPHARTGGRGDHYWFRYDGRKLKKSIDGVDFQRVGKYVIVPPSITAHAYEWRDRLPTDLDALPELPGWLVDLADLASRDEGQNREHELGDHDVAGGHGSMQFREPSSFVNRDRDELAEAVESLTSWSDLLGRHGWTHVGGDKWRHPSSTNPFSGTITNDCLFVYSPNTPFEVTEPGDPHGYTLFAATELLDYLGDRKALISTLRARGFLESTESRFNELMRRTLLNARLEDVVGGDGDELRVREEGSSHAENLLDGLVDFPALKRKEDDIEQRWLCEPIVAVGRSHALYAPAKVGKSLLMLELAACVATGRAFLDHPAQEPMRVIYCDYEMTEDDVQERLEGFGFDLDDPLLDANLKYHLLGSGDGLDTFLGGQKMIATALHFKAQLVIVDTMSRAVSGAEDENDTIRAFYRFTGAPLKRLGIAVVRLDHAGKDASKGQRGASAKNDDVDIVWRLTRVEGAKSEKEQFYNLDATHHRMGWVPNRVELKITKRKDESSTWQRRGERRYPDGTADLAIKLNELNVNPRASIRAMRAVLTEHGLTASTEKLQVVNAFRAELAAGTLLAKLAKPPEELGTPLGTPSEDPWAEQ